MSFFYLILLVTTALTALITGLFYSYSCSVNPGLAQLPDENYVAAMQSINQAIQNPAFFLSFMGTLVMLPVAAFMSYRNGITLQFYLLLTAALVYGIGSFGVTAAGNVPLNNTLAAFNLKAATAVEISAARRAFEEKWNSLHQIRTWASLIALILSVVACLYHHAKAASANL